MKAIFNPCRQNQECAIIKGITKIISIPATIKNEKTELTIKTTFDLNRRDFEIGNPSIVMSKNVTVSIDIKILK